MQDLCGQQQIVAHGDDHSDEGHHSVGAVVIHIEAEGIMDLHYQMILNLLS